MRFFYWGQTERWSTQRHKIVMHAARFQRYDYQKRLTFGDRIDLYVIRSFHALGIFMLFRHSDSHTCGTMIVTRSACGPCPRCNPRACRRSHPPDYPDQIGSGGSCHHVGRGAITRHQSHDSSGLRTSNSRSGEDSRVLPRSMS